MKSVSRNTSSKLTQHSLRNVTLFSLRNFRKYYTRRSKPLRGPNMVYGPRIGGLDLKHQFLSRNFTIKLGQTSSEGYAFEEPKF